MDTTSNALSITFHLLAENPEVQGKLRAEILDASKEAVFDYDTLVSLPYLDAVCRETLRLYVHPFMYDFPSYLRPSSVIWQSFTSYDYLSRVRQCLLSNRRIKCSRLCRAHQDTVLPLSQPIRGVDGKMMHEITVPSGTPIVVGILSANRNKAIWGADALEWKPERWLVGLPSTVTEAKIPGVYSNLSVDLP